MKKILTVLLFSLFTPYLIHAQYLGGNGNGNSVDSLINIQISVHKISGEVPDKYELFQNYPNPFNPSTIIKFKIKTEGLVTIKIYDIQSKEIATLINENLKAGTYEIPFSIYQIQNKGIPSGVLFYRMEAEGKIFTRKMIIIK